MGGFISWTLEQIFCHFTVKEEDFGGSSNIHAIYLLFDDRILSRGSQEPSKSCAEFRLFFCLFASASKTKNISFKICHEIFGNKFITSINWLMAAELQQEHIWSPSSNLIKSYHIEIETFTKMLIWPNYLSFAQIQYLFCLRKSKLLVYAQSVMFIYMKT